MREDNGHDVWIEECLVFGQIQCLKRLIKFRCFRSPVGLIKSVRLGVISLIRHLDEFEINIAKDHGSVYTILWGERARPSSYRSSNKD